MIILCFDAHKLDISDEFKRTIESLKGNEDKIKIVLNKSDSITQQELMRVYSYYFFSYSLFFVLSLIHIGKMIWCSDVVFGQGHEDS